MMLARMQLAHHTTTRSRGSQEYGDCMSSRKNFYIKHIIYFLSWQILEIWFPICQDRIYSNLLWALVEPVYSTYDLHRASICWAVLDFYLSREYRPTAWLYPTWTCSTCHTSLCKKSTTIQSYSKIIFIVGPVRERIRACRSWEEPGSIFGIEYIWSWCDDRTTGVTDTSCDISIDFPTVYFIARKSEPIRISYIDDSLYPFPGEIYRFYIVLSITSVVETSY